MRRVDLTNWALRTSPKFTARLNISSIRVFDLIRDREIPISLCPPHPGLASTNHQKILECDWANFSENVSTLLPSQLSGRTSEFRCQRLRFNSSLLLFILLWFKIVQCINTKRKTNTSIMQLDFSKPNIKFMLFISLKNVYNINNLNIIYNAKEL